MVNPTSADDIARSLADELVRQDVVDLLDDRWAKPLTLIAAPGGYGKTRALAQAVRSNQEDPVGVEFYLRLRPGDVDPMRLGTSMLQALGASVERSSEAVSLGERIIDEFASFSPTKVVLILDDVHLIESGASAISLVMEIVRDLPTNSHIVLAGRRLPELPLARLEADDGVVHIGQAQLTFSSTEIELLAERHGVGSETLTELGGWPALIRLAVAAGKSGPQEFLMQEIVNDLPAEVVRGLMVAALAGRADADLFEACGIEISLDHLADSVPMVDLAADGELWPHELWPAVLEEAGDHEERQQFVEAIVSWHGDNRRHDDAISLAAHHANGVGARNALMRALDGAETNLHAASTGRWLELLGGGDSVDVDDAELLLLRGWHKRLALGPGNGDDDVVRALDVFRERGDAFGEARASVEHAFRGFLAGETAPVLDAVARSPRLVESGVEYLQPLGEMTHAIINDLNGNFAAALDNSQRSVGPGVPMEFAELALRHRATLSFLVGDGDAAVDATAELLDLSRSERNETIDKLTRFANGDIADVIAGWPEIRYGASGNLREDFTHGVISVFVDACLGYTPDLTMARTAAWDRPREQIQLALCEWSGELMAGDEAQANARLSAQVAELGLEDPQLLGELRRYPVSGYIAVSSVREYFDDPQLDPPLGRYHRDRLEVARILVALREGETPDWSYKLTPQQVISSMSLPWSVELACGLVLHDEQRGLELVDAIFTATGARAQGWLRSLADSESLVAEGAQRLLSILPSPPSEPTTIVTRGTVALRRADGDAEVSRARVRQLLLLLVLRGSVSRDFAMTALWPDKDIDKARNNFRITLSHLRDELEPGRQSGEPSYHVRQRGDDVVLHQSEHLQSDVWHMRDGLAQAEAARLSGDRASRLAALGPVVESWDPPLLGDLADIAGLEAEVAGLRAQLRDATVEVAEARLSVGRFDDAQELGRKLLATNEYDERAHAIVIASHLDNERLAQAHQAIDRCLAMLTELNVGPTAATRMLLRRARYGDDASRQTA